MNNQKNHAAIELKGISKRFGSVVANNNIDLSVRQGEILALLGENGSGNAEKLSGIGSINGFVRSMGCEQTAN